MRPPDDAKQVGSQQATLESVVATLRRAVSAVSDVGRWLDHVGTAAAVGVNAIAKQRAGIEIRTQEGDVVRIKYSNRLEVNAGAARTSDSESGVAVQQVSVAQRERSRVSVDGNLNADELQAIDAVLVKIDSLAEEFFAGDFEAAFAQAAAFNFDSEQLAKVAVRLSQQQRIAVVASQASELPTLRSADTAPAVPVAEGQVVAAEPVAHVDAKAQVQPTTTSNVGAPTATDNAIGNSIVQYVAKLNGTLRATREETHLGFGFHAKLDLLLASIKAKRPDSVAPIDGATNKLQEVAAKAAELA